MFYCKEFLMQRFILVMSVLFFACTLVAMDDLIEATRCGDLERVNELLDMGVGVNRHQGDFTPLHAAAVCGNSAVVSRLLQVEEIDVNAQGPYQATPLHYAAGNGHAAVVRLLLRHKGIRLDISNIQGNAPDYCAEEEGHHSIALMIRRHYEIPKILALASALHDRLGDQSPASLLTYDGSLHMAILDFSLE